MAERITFDLGPAIERIEARVERAMRAVALQGEAIAKVALSQPGKGRLYPRGKTAVHRASAPGDPPAVDTGRLRASTTHEVVRESDRVTARVIANSDYALGLETGTEKVAPRPFLRPTLATIRGQAFAILKRFLV